MLDTSIRELGLEISVGFRVLFQSIELIMRQWVFWYNRLELGTMKSRTVHVRRRVCVQSIQASWYRVNMRRWLDSQSLPSQLYYVMVSWNWNIHIFIIYAIQETKLPRGKLCPDILLWRSRDAQKNWLNTFWDDVVIQWPRQEFCQNEMKAGVNSLVNRMV